MTGVIVAALSNGFLVTGPNVKLVWVDAKGDWYATLNDDAFIFSMFPVVVVWVMFWFDEKVVVTEAVMLEFLENTSPIRFGPRCFFGVGKVVPLIVGLLVGVFAFLIGFGVQDFFFMDDKSCKLLFDVVLTNVLGYCLVN